jgi:GDPmannose 4,6-dehydratase
MKALITGITGQDGSYLAEFLLSRGYEVHGTGRQSSDEDFERINHIIHRIHLHQADLIDQLSIIRLIEEIGPDEIYNLAAQTSPSSYWSQPMMVGEINALGATRLLEAIRLVNTDIRFFQASSAEMYGYSADSPQTEQTPFHPVTPNGISKLYAHWTTIAYREKYGLKACCGILFDHESPRRAMEFVTRKITDAAARIKLGLQEKLVLTTLDIQRDWGYAGDFIRAYWMMLQNTTPEDFVIATGQCKSLTDFCRCAFDAVQLDWREHVEIDPLGSKSSRSFRLRGDATRARQKLLWEPEISFEEMVHMMVETEIERYSPKNRLPTDSISQERFQENRPV